MRLKQSLVETHVLEFSDWDGNDGACKVTIKPMTTRETLNLLVRMGTSMVFMGDKMVFDAAFMEDIWRGGVVNIEAPEFKYRKDHIGEAIDRFDYDEACEITSAIVKLMQLPEEEKKTLS